MFSGSFWFGLLSFLCWIQPHHVVETEKSVFSVWIEAFSCRGYFMLRRFTKVQHAAWTLRINVLEVCVTSVVPAEPKQIGLLEKLQSRLCLDASRSRRSEFLLQNQLSVMPPSLHFPSPRTHTSSSGEKLHPKNDGLSNRHQPSLKSCSFTGW
jgi:hypothetical protein